MCSYLSRCLQLRYTLRTTGGQFEFLCWLRPHTMIIIVVICQFEMRGLFYSRGLCTPRSSFRRMSGFMTCEVVSLAARDDLSSSTKKTFSSQRA